MSTDGALRGLRAVEMRGAGAGGAGDEEDGDTDDGVAGRDDGAADGIAEDPKGLGNEG